MVQRAAAKGARQLAHELPSESTARWGMSNGWVVQVHLWEAVHGGFDVHVDEFDGKVRRQGGMMTNPLESL